MSRLNCLMPSYRLKTKLVATFWREVLVFKWGLMVWFPLDLISKKLYTLHKESMDSTNAIKIYQQIRKISPFQY